MKFDILITLALVQFVACTEHRLNFDKAIILRETVNFSAVNSEYDDYNSAEIKIEANNSFSLIFSTNRNSSGNNFDFIYYDCTAYSNLINGEFRIDANQVNSSLVDSINSPNNELGPYLTYDLAYNYYSNRTLENSEKRFFYTSDINGNLDIRFNYYTVEHNGYFPDGNPTSLTGINTVFDEGYLTIHPNENTNKETCYFTSNRENNNFDIYRAISEEDKLIDESDSFEVIKVEQLSSDADDKCPFIKGNVIVFTSNRTGGFGGFDLWFSAYNGTEWSAPENFGENINTEYDEYRPIIIQTNKDEFFNDLMLFSSNRPGGKGMYDLYYAGLSKID